jgi:hypothetical protein
MTRALVTIDTEMSLWLFQKGASTRVNFESSILGQCAAGAFGIGWQMDQMEACGVKGVFFVDPMSGLVLGEQVIADIVGAIVSRGHEIALHIHPEWLRWVKDSPVDGRLGQSIASFGYDDQVTLLRLAKDMLVRAGAPNPVAFRAGNFGANDDSLMALAAIGIAWDSSFTPGGREACSGISLPSGLTHPVRHAGIIEVPVSGLFDRPGRFRPAQVCAVSAAEMRAALNHAAESDHPVFNIVTHSFEMLSRDRTRPNRIVLDRFAATCRTIADHPKLSSAVFADLEPGVADQPIKVDRFQSHPLRTMKRMGEQLIGAWIYERQLRPMSALQEAKAAGTMWNPEAGTYSAQAASSM